MIVDKITSASDQDPKIGASVLFLSSPPFLFVPPFPGISLTMQTLLGPISFYRTNNSGAIFLCESLSCKDEEKLPTLGYLVALDDC